MLNTIIRKKESYLERVYPLTYSVFVVVCFDCMHKRTKTDRNTKAF